MSLVTLFLEETDAQEKYHQYWVSNKQVYYYSLG